MNDFPVEAVLDTGTEITILSEEFASQLSKPGFLQGLEPIRLCGFGMTGVTSGWRGLQVNIFLAGKLTSWPVYVSPMRDKVLLGLDFLQAADAVIHAHGGVCIGNTLVPKRMHPDSKYRVSRVVLAQNTSLPPEAKQLLLALVEDPAQGVTTMLEPTSFHEDAMAGVVLVQMNH